MSDLKLRQLNELNSRLRDDLERPRIKVSEASISLIQYCSNTKDLMVPSLWGTVDKSEDPYIEQLPDNLKRLSRAMSTMVNTQPALVDKREDPYTEQLPGKLKRLSRAMSTMINTQPTLVDEHEDPYAPQQSDGCCSVM